MKFYNRRVEFRLYSNITGYTLRFTTVACPTTKLIRTQTHAQSKDFLPLRAICQYVLF